MTDQVPTAPLRRGLSFSPVFSKSNSPFDDIEWEERDIEITDKKSGDVIFKQDGFRVPKFWSHNAGQIVASKYAFGPEGERETGVDDVINRVVNAITLAGMKMGYFETGSDANTFRRELKYLCVHQYGAFNSPVWFNVGIYESRGLAGSGTVYYWDHRDGVVDFGKPGVYRTTESYKHPQTSACFIQSVEDTMESIMELATSEAMLFKHGSGSGTDFSKVRSTMESLSTGGKPSGPLSFMRVYDRIASVVKSGGKTRRAAKMQTIRDRHPNVMEFIRAKGREEEKVKALIEAGFDGSFNGEAYDTVAFQNANFSVGISNDFMFKLEKSPDEEVWPLIAVTTGQVLQTIKPLEIWEGISEATWECGDPGVQFANTINQWHTCPFDKTGTKEMPINSSNPCSEYLFQDDSACNLASLRLTKFYRDGKFDVELFRSAIEIFIVAQEILVDYGSYPTRKIAQNQHDFRTLGLGFADLGGLLMRMGLPYDSAKGRSMAGAIAAILTGEGYRVSARMAREFGPFEGFRANRGPMLGVISNHKWLAKRALESSAFNTSLEALWIDAKQAWDWALTEGSTYGFRNAQISVVAPTGTIAFMMDCDTTGIEPSIGLRAYKTLAGGGDMVIVNDAVGDALRVLKYDDNTALSIMCYIEENGHVLGCEDLDSSHYAVFDTALAPFGCDRVIDYKGHLGMMAAVQPFISGAISKTVNVPEEFTPRQIADVYRDAWRLGLKCVAIYRDNSKWSQPMTLDRFEEVAEVCVHCSSTMLVAAGTCAVCPNCGTAQGGCS